MLQFKELLNIQKKSKIYLNAIEKLVVDLNNIIDSVNSDQSRSVEWKKETIQNTRDQFLPSFVDKMNVINEMADEAAINKPLWESVPLLLSLQKFSEEPEKDAQIRLAYSNELKDLPLPLLELTLRNARADGNLPLMFQCWKIGVSAANQNSLRDMVDLLLDGLVIPDQAEALAAIEQTWQDRMTVASMYEMYCGRELTALKRLQIARAEQPTVKTVNYRQKHDWF